MNYGQKEVENVDTVDQEIDRRFLQIPFELVNNVNFRNNHKDELVLYWFMCSRVVRKQMRNKLNIYNQYYKNNLLACSMSYGVMAKAFNTNERTIKRWVKKLERLGYLEIRKVKITGHQKMNVYIVGTHDNYIPYYFLNEVYGIK